MKKIISFLCLLLLATMGFSQSRFPNLKIEGDSSFLLEIEKMEVKVSIFGNTAVTCMDIEFYNHLDQVLEGELTFPLGEGQVVSGFEMEVNGKMRKGVIVEKKKGRQAFERIVRQEIDPGLLEMTEGNNFRTRIYPIPALGKKRVIICYEETLKKQADNYLYTLPLAFENSIQDFKILMEVSGTSNPKLIHPQWFPTWKFDRLETLYKADFQKQNYVANQSLSVAIPTQYDEDQIFTQEIDGETYFYVELPIDFQMLRQKKNPQKLAVYWDVSLSGLKRDLEKEQIFLFEYLKYLSECDLEIITFSNTVQDRKSFKINNKNLREVEQYFRRLIYDGGTQLGCLNAIDVIADEYLLFTDGLSNFGNRDFKSKSNPVIVINSGIEADPSKLNFIAAQSKGHFINLVNMEIQEALNDLKIEPICFLKATHRSKIFDVYPKVSQKVGETFTLLGKLKNKKGKLKLYFGHGNQIVLKKTLKIKSDDKNGSAYDLRRLWAKQKLAHLLFNRVENEAAITQVGKTFDLVTPYTSLIVLDRVEDYIQYGIEPPEELKKAYQSMMAEKGNDTERQLQRFEKEMARNQKETLFYWEDFSDWYEGIYKAKKKTAPSVTPAPPVIGLSAVESVDTIKEEVVAAQEVPTPEPEPIVLTSFDTANARLITGIIKTEGMGETLIGANVIVKGTNIGTTTNIEGQYQIYVPEDKSILVYSYIGYTTHEVTIGTSNQIDVSMEEGDVSLEAVVVTSKVESKRTFSAATTSMIMRVPGVSNGATVRGSRSSATDYYIDGIKVDGRGQGELDLVIGNSEDELSEEEIGEQMMDFARQTVFIDSLNAVKEGDQYAKYLELRETYEQVPFFYIDVVNFFREKGDNKTALMILSNLAEIKLEDYQLMRALGHYLFSMRQYREAILVFEKVLELRPDEPQSYRDLALIHDANGNPQKAIDLLYRIITKDFIENYDDLTETTMLYEGMEEVVLADMNGIINRNKGKLNLSKIKPQWIKPIEMDLRVIVNWNTSSVDLDLWIEEPSGSTVKFSNTEGDSGGHLSEDLTEGYGPESYSLKKAPAGNYDVLIDLYSDDQQTISGGTIVQVYIYTHFGRTNQKMESMTLRVAETDIEEVKVGTFVVGKNNPSQ